MDSGYEETVFLLFTCNVNRLKLLWYATARFTPYHRCYHNKSVTVRNGKCAYFMEGIIIVKLLPPKKQME